MKDDRQFCEAPLSPAREAWLMLIIIVLAALILGEQIRLIKALALGMGLGLAGVTLLALPSDDCLPSLAQAAPEILESDRNEGHRTVQSIGIHQLRMRRSLNRWE